MVYAIRELPEPRIEPHGALREVQGRSGHCYDLSGRDEGVIHWSVVRGPYEPQLVRSYCLALQQWPASYLMHLLVGDRIETIASVHVRYLADPLRPLRGSSGCAAPC